MNSFILDGVIAEVKLRMDRKEVDSILGKPWVWAGKSGTIGGQACSWTKSPVWQYFNNALVILFDDADRVENLSVYPESIQAGDGAWAGWPEDMDKWRIVDLRRWLESASIPYRIVEKTDKAVWLLGPPGFFVFGYPYGDEGKRALDDQKIFFLAREISSESLERGAKILFDSKTSEK